MKGNAAARAENVHEAYEFVGGRMSHPYDDMMAGATWLGRLALRVFWQLPPESYLAFRAQMFDGLPKAFCGRLLEVPVGTGVLSLPHYRAFPSADITCLDYSANMLGVAEQRAEALGLKNIRFHQGDIAHLPYEDQTFDLVLSIDGLHAVPDKEAALREIRRALKPGGTFTGCVYIRGENAFTDLFVQAFCTWRGYFTPPFDDFASLHSHLGQYFTGVKLTHVGAFAGFTCKKA